MLKDFRCNIQVSPTCCGLVEVGSIVSITNGGYWLPIRDAAKFTEVLRDYLEKTMIVGRFRGAANIIIREPHVDEIDAMQNAGWWVGPEWATSEPSFGYNIRMFTLIIKKAYND